jgi:hypothetical protein
MMHNKSNFELLAGKMRQPIHINYLAKYVLKKSLAETQEIIDRGVEEGVFEEVNFKGYYRIKNI